MMLYHGSGVEVKEPKIMSAIRVLDFGPVFYTTLNRDRAACELFNSTDADVYVHRCHGATHHCRVVQPCRHRRIRDEPSMIHNSLHLRTTSSCQMNDCMGRVNAELLVLADLTSEPLLTSKARGRYA